MLIEDECGTQSTCTGKGAQLTFEIGARLIYLPAYSPDLNPIEEAFSFIKAWLRRHEFLYTGTHELPMMVFKAIHAITPEIALGWLADCGYVP